MSDPLLRFGHAVVACLVSLACASCVTTGEVDSRSATLAPDSGYFVLGVQPDHMLVKIVDGDVRGGAFYPSTKVVVWGVFSTLMAMPQDGFVLGKAPAGTTLALVMAQPRGSGTFSFGLMYSPCPKRSATVVFKVQPGKVVYVTSIAFNSYRGGLLPSFTDTDIAGARAYLKIHYPQFVDQLEQGSYQMIPTVPSIGC
jgi:hypothetical protein